MIFFSFLAQCLGNPTTETGGKLVYSTSYTHFPSSILQIQTCHFFVVKSTQILNYKALYVVLINLVYHKYICHLSGMQFLCPFWNHQFLLFLPCIYWIWLHLRMCSVWLVPILFIADLVYLAVWGLGEGTTIILLLYNHIV